jgi:hypothetical protein
VTTAAAPKTAVESAHPALEELSERLASQVNGAYADFIGTATDEDVAGIYPSQTYERLAAVERRYAPENLFAGNHNVRPRRQIAEGPIPAPAG